MAKKILVVDDEKDLRNLIKRVLVRAKYDVITANNGKEGLTKLYDEAPDMVILDVNMPEMDGWETCQEIRKDPLYKHLPIIMLTVRKTTDDQIKGLNLGSDCYLIKPFYPKELVARVTTLLQKVSP